MKHLALDAAGARDTAALDAFLTEAFDAYAKALGHDRSGPHGWLDEAIAANRVSVWRREGAIEAVLVTTVDHARETTTVDVIAVAPARAGQGLGSEILRMVEERARARGHRAVKLHTAAVRTDLVAFYSRRGYAVTGVAPPAHGRDSCPRVHMEKTLQ